SHLPLNNSSTTSISPLRNDHYSSSLRSSDKRHHSEKHHKHSHSHRSSKNNNEQIGPPIKIKISKDKVIDSSSASSNDHLSSPSTSLKVYNLFYLLFPLV